MDHRPAPRRRRAPWTVLVVVSLLAALGAGVGSAASSDGGGSAGAATPAVGTVPAYWLVAQDGGVFSCGGAQFYGSTGALRLNRPIVGMAATPDHGGYWLVASDGGVFSFGDARFYGSTGNLVLNRPIVGMAPTPDGGGYWLVASDGGVFSFGDAHFYGSTGNLVLNRPVVGMAPAPGGGGYWMVAADGGVFSFGDAHFWGSTGNLHLNQPIVSMTATPDGGGYRFVASDGGVFDFGDATFQGSLGAVPQTHPVVGLAGTPDGRGYWMANANGGVTNFGDAAYWGSAPQVLARPVVGLAEANGSGANTCSAYTSGSYGYDISNWQCGNTPTGPHPVAVVEVVGASFGGVNPCLASEAAWAAGGLNLYMYLTYGSAPSSADGNCQTTASPASCNYGYNAALDAFTKASRAGISTQVGWWLDVEPDPSWSGSPGTGANASVVQGALDGLHSQGINSAGIYTTPLTWSTIVGSYHPAVPLWLAWWTKAPQQNCSTGMAYAASHGVQLPTGGLVLTQYDSNTYDDDYAC